MCVEEKQVRAEFEDGPETLGILRGVWDVKAHPETEAGERGKRICPRWSRSWS